MATAHRKIINVHWFPIPFLHLTDAKLPVGGLHKNPVNSGIDNNRTIIVRHFDKQSSIFQAKFLFLHNTTREK